MSKNSICSNIKTMDASSESQPVNFIVLLDPIGWVSQSTKSSSQKIVIKHSFEKVLVKETEFYVVKDKLPDEVKGKKH